MEIYLVRHTTPAVEKGTCYGQADLDVTDSFHSEAEIIKQVVPDTVKAVYASPLKRCTLLAEHLYNDYPIRLCEELKEIDCGDWEMRLWDDIPKEQLKPWMDDLANVPTLNGESYTDLYNRVSRMFDHIHQQELPAVIVAHGGVIRSILSHVTSTAVVDSFKLFSYSYGCVIRLVKNDGHWNMEVLSNIPREKEMHKPSKY
ncbi:MAG: alpha-ribazole phosphatase [Ferruginibacter sp.]|nr:alpha-ribazole phosphatase [Ferruginibacter sp.]